MQALESVLRVFVELHPDDAARALENVDPANAVQLFNELPASVAGPLLERIGMPAGAPMVAQLAEERIGEMLSRMSPRFGALVLKQLDEDRRDAILASLSSNVAEPLRALVKYPPESAGAIMEPRVASLAIDQTAQEAINKIRKTPRDVLHYLYVTRRDGKLIGVLNMRDLLLADPRAAIEPLVKRNVITVPDTMDQERVVDLMRERRFLALPVVDYEDRLVGVVKHDDVLEVGQLEAFEDMQRTVGAGADERALSPVSLVVKSRLPWLYVNLGTAFLAAAVIGVFEGIIARMAALAVLLPVVAGQGGNAGSQSLAIVMRGLALREIIPGVKKRVVMKEVVGGLINGVLVAVVTALAVFGWRHVSGDTALASTALAVVIGLAMVVNMVAAAAAGAAIPLALKSLGRDPAQSASIFLTTVTDVIGFASFLGFATAFAALLT